MQTNPASLWHEGSPGKPEMHLYNSCTEYFNLLDPSGCDWMLSVPSDSAHRSFGSGRLWLRRNRTAAEESLKTHWGMLKAYPLIFRPLRFNPWQIKPLNPFGLPLSWPGPFRAHTTQTLGFHGGFISSHVKYSDTLQLSAALQNPCWRTFYSYWIRLD